METFKIGDIVIVESFKNPRKYPAEIQQQAAIVSIFNGGLGCDIIINTGNTPDIKNEDHLTASFCYINDLNIIAKSQYSGDVEVILSKFGRMKRNCTFKCENGTIDSNEDSKKIFDDYYHITLNDSFNIEKYARPTKKVIVKHNDNFKLEERLFENRDELKPGQILILDSDYLVEDNLRLIPSKQAAILDNRNYVHVRVIDENRFPGFPYGDTIHISKFKKYTISNYTGEVEYSQNFKSHKGNAENGILNIDGLDTWLTFLIDRENIDKYMPITKKVTVKHDDNFKLEEGLFES